jgi:hypothetical protein
MHIFIPLLLVVQLLLHAVSGHCGSVTFYLDGAIIETEAVASKGVLSIPLPARVIEGSLRIRPAGGTSIQRVDISSSSKEAGTEEKELEALLEQRSRLEDRLKALATREEIFKSAAKSQSGKAPRKTKANPDPMQAIRQGTEFAIAQLEAVYTSRRRTDQEIRRLDSRIATARGRGRGAETVARVQLSPARGRVTVRYAVSGHGWVPRYDLYLDDGTTAQLYLSGRFSGLFAGHLPKAAPAALAEQGTAPVLPVQSGPLARLASYRLPVTGKQHRTGLPGSFSAVLTNTEQIWLPGGEASLYTNGEYVGKVRFGGISSGRSRTVSTGG